MFRKALFAVSALALVAGAPNLAIAKSIKDMITRESLVQYCTTAGVDTETTATVQMPDGSTVTGTIHCESEDMTLAGDDSMDGVSSAEDPEDSVDSPDDDDDDGVDDNSGQGDDDGVDGGDDDDDNSGPGGDGGQGGGDDDGGDDDGDDD